MREKLMVAPPTATASTSADTKKYTSDDEDRMDTCLVFAANDILVFLHVPVDRDRAAQQAVDVLAELGERLLNAAPFRTHLAEQCMPLAAGFVVSGHGLLVRFDEGLVNVSEDVADAHSIVLGIHRGNRFDCGHPAGWIRRHFDSRLVIILDPVDRFAEAAMQ